MSISVESTQNVSELYDIEELPKGWKIALVTYSTKNGLRKTIQILDCRTEPPMQYRHDSLKDVALKCAGLVLGIPIFAIFNIFIHFVRTVTLVIGTLVRSTVLVLQEKSLKSVINFCQDWTWGVSEILLRGTWDIVRLLAFALKMHLCCLYGIFFPLEGRALAGAAEHVIKGSDRTNDLRFRADYGNALYDLFTNKDSKVCFHWAFCFQPVGPINDKVTHVEYLIPRGWKSACRQFG